MSFVPTTFQVPVRTVSELTNLNFSPLFGWDRLNDSTSPLNEAREALGTLTPGLQVHTFQELQL
ncbi:hypothetical protein [Arthrobacter oryzae]|uniref:hypothetical protein n=1 Tax=Arthrobacter oryzae TaxID=409290 RepID=UPI0016057749|nr:hypothetical protein [Arthrobacter oryzae]